MPSEVAQTEAQQHHFTCAADYESFLDKYHLEIPDVYLKLAKQASGIPSITAAEAVEVSLCFGWIDGRGHMIDGNWWTIRHLPRRPKSVWSQKNVDTVGRLFEEGRMRPAGVAVVEAAKADGRWQRAYAGPATVKVSDDVATALADVPAAASFFEYLNKTDRYAVLVKIEMASPTARPNRIRALVQMMAAGERPAPLSKGRAKATRITVQNGPEKTKVSKVTKSGSGTRRTGVVKPSAVNNETPDIAPTRRSSRLLKLGD